MAATPLTPSRRFYHTGIPLHPLPFPLLFVAPPRNDQKDPTPSKIAVIWFGRRAPSGSCQSYFATAQQALFHDLFSVDICTAIRCVSPLFSAGPRRMILASTGSTGMCPEDGPKVACGMEKHRPALFADLPRRRNEPIELRLLIVHGNNSTISLSIGHRKP
ncbi:hypothetical protein MPH_07040 [Macrophomina phaseolina MS6]|uniref:Uncharacterized protein n=1 Tax=Macrophomina phaseolina (strain MS6) TaxID=1126212 RepID=K2SFL6_MACPH|nr:hypothetical protein MPH_07040 [Macrophomina phaseolina MS6]